MYGWALRSAAMTKAAIDVPHGSTHRLAVAWRGIVRALEAVPEVCGHGDGAPTRLSLMGAAVRHEDVEAARKARRG